MKDFLNSLTFQQISLDSTNMFVNYTMRRRDGSLFSRGWVPSGNPWLSWSTQEATELQPSVNACNPGIQTHIWASWLFPGGSDGKSFCLQCGRPGFDPWVGKIPWRRQWHPTPVLLPGKSHGRRSLMGYSPWGRKESDTTEQLHSLIHSLWAFYYMYYSY